MGLRGKHALSYGEVAESQSSAPLNLGLPYQTATKTLTAGVGNDPKNPVNLTPILVEFSSKGKDIQSADCLEKLREFREAGLAPDVLQGD